MSLPKQVKSYPVEFWEAQTAAVLVSGQTGVSSIKDVRLDSGGEELASWRKLKIERIPVYAFIFAVTHTHSTSYSKVH